MAKEIELADRIRNVSRKLRGALSQIDVVIAESGADRLPASELQALKGLTFEQLVELIVLARNLRDLCDRLPQ